MTNTEDEENIINCPDGPTYPDQKSVSRSGATPDSITFMQGLDCFLYRTSDNWFETYGRVVFEAMACGVPVVAHRRGGYSHFLHDGQDSLLFDTDDEAFVLVMNLKTDATLRRRIALNARRRVEEMFSANSLAEITQYFLAPKSQHNSPATERSSEAPRPNAAH
ncbi:MAG: glycosyltransferase [Steroidobacteraceae bacterium]